MFKLLTENRNSLSYTCLKFGLFSILPSHLKAFQGVSGPIMLLLKFQKKICQSTTREHVQQPSQELISNPSQKSPLKPLQEQSWIHTAELPKDPWQESLPSLEQVATENLSLQSLHKPSQEPSEPFFKFQPFSGIFAATWSTIYICDTCKWTESTMVIAGALEIITWIKANLMESISCHRIVSWFWKCNIILKEFVETMFRKTTIQQIHQVPLKQLLAVQKLSFRNILTMWVCLDWKQELILAAVCQKMLLTQNQNFNLVAHCLDDPETPIFLNLYHCIKI